MLIIVVVFTIINVIAIIIFIIIIFINVLFNIQMQDTWNLQIWELGRIEGIEITLNRVTK